MKNLIAVLYLLPLTLLAQNDTIPQFSISVAGNYQIGLGNSYFNDAYANPLGLRVTVQQNFVKNIFWGFSFSHNHMPIIRKELLGSFYSANSQYLGIVIGFRHRVLDNKFRLEHYAGTGYKIIYNKSELATYKIDAIVPSIGSKLNYPIAKNLDLFFQLDFMYFRNDVAVDEPYKSFYRDAYLLEPSIGIRINL